MTSLPTLSRVAAAAALLLLSACPGDAPRTPGAEPEALQAVKVGIAIPSYVHAVAWIGEEKGHFQAEGLETSVQVMGGSAATMRALISGAIDVGLAGGDAVLKANRAGADLVVVGGVVDRFYHRLIVPESIQSADDLRGKTIGLAILGGPQEVAARYALESLGLKPDEDVTIRSMGKEFNRLAGLSRGDVQATISQTPPSRLAELKLRVLVDLPALDVRFPYATVVTTRETLTQHPERVRAFLKGLTAAIRFYKDPANQAECLEIIGRTTKSSDTQEAALERYQVGGPSMLSDPPYPSEEGFRTVLTFLEISDVKPADVFELKLLDEVTGSK